MKTTRYKIWKVEIKDSSQSVHGNCSCSWRTEAGRLNFVSCKRQSNPIKEAKKRTNFYNGDRNVHACWMRIHHSRSFGVVAAEKARGRHAATATARGLCLLSTFSALTLASQLGFPHRRNALSASYPAFLALFPPFLSFPFGRKCWQTGDRYGYGYVNIYNLLYIPFSTLLFWLFWSFRLLGSFWLFRFSFWLLLSLQLILLKVFRIWVLKEGSLSKIIITKLMKYITTTKSYEVINMGEMGIFLRGSMIYPMAFK